MFRLKKDFLITVLTVLVPLVMQFFYVRYISYNVDKIDYGNFILLQTLITALSYVFLQIPSQAYDRFYNTTKNKLYFANEFRSLLIIINIISLFIIICYGYFMDKFSYDILLILFFYFVLLNNYSFNQKIFLLNLERKKYFYIKFFEGIAKFVIPVIFYIYEHTLFSFLLGFTVGYTIAFSILHLFMKDYKFYFVFNFNNLKKYFLFAYPFLFISIYSWGIAFSDRYFIEFLSTTENLAIYALLAQVAGFGQIIGQIYTIYVSPKILKQFEEDREQSLIMLKKYLTLLFLIFVFLGIIAFLIPVELYSLLLEPTLIEQSYFFYTFIILLAGIFITIFQTALGMYLNLFKKLGVLSYIYLLAFIINIYGNFYIKEYGILAAAVSTLIAYITILIGQLIYLKLRLLK